MKRHLAVIGLIFIAMAASAQQTWPDSTRKHEVGVDVTAFLGQFFSHVNSDGVGTFLTVSPYWATYRYHFGHCSIRFALGGSINDDETPTYGGPDAEPYHNKSSELDLRVGIERAQELSKRWQVFYGLDFRPSCAHIDNDFIYSQGYYQYGRESRETDLGIAPLLGVRYRITPRFSILTETSLAFVSSTFELREYSTPQDDAHSPQPDRKQTTNSFDTRFTPPLSIVATFDL